MNRTYMGGVERGQRNVGVVNLCDCFSHKVLLVSTKTTGGGLRGEVIRAEETIERINRIVKETVSSKRGNLSSP